MQIDKPVLGSILCSLFGFLLGLMALLSGTHGLLEQGHILRYNYSAIGANGTAAAEGFWASLHILHVCRGGPASKIECVNTKNGRINGQSLREGGGGGDFAIPGFILLITLSVQAGICGITMLYLGIFKHQGIYRKHQPNHQPWPFLLFVAGVSGFVAACTGTAFAIKESNGTPDSSRAAITYSPIWISFLWFGMASTFAAAFSEQRERLIESISGDTFGGSCEAGWKERLGFWKLKWKKG